MDKFWHERTIDDVEVSARTSRIISAWRPGITLGDLARTPARDLLALPHFGRRSLNELRDAIRGARDTDVRFQAVVERKRIIAWAEENSDKILAILNGDAVIVRTSRFPLEGDDDE